MDLHPLREQVAGGLIARSVRGSEDLAGGSGHGLVSLDEAFKS